MVCAQTADPARNRGARTAHEEREHGWKPGATHDHLPAARRGGCARSWSSGCAWRRWARGRALHPLPGPRRISLRARHAFERGRRGCRAATQRRCAGCRGRGSEKGCRCSTRRPTPSAPPTTNWQVVRAGAVAAPLPNGEVLIAGGTGEEQTAELYDPATGAFTPRDRKTARPLASTGSRRVCPTGTC